MDRTKVVAALAVAACGGPPAPTHPADTPVTVVARGTLAYGVGFAGDRLVTVELGERFELLVRDAPAAAPRALDLGAPERDWPALACTADRAFVGGDTGDVVVVDVAPDTGDAAPRELARWPVGAPVTALATLDGLVAIGDATGVVCLRRIDDGALLQCVVAHDGPITALEPHDGALVSRAADGAHVWQIPSLAGPSGADAAGIAWGARQVRVDGRRVVDDAGRTVVEMAGPVRAVAVSQSGKLAIAAWISALDQPSVVLVR